MRARSNAWALACLALTSASAARGEETDTTVAVEVRATTDHQAEAPGAEAHVEGWHSGAGIGHWSVTAGVAPGADGEPFPVVHAAVQGETVPGGFQLDIERDRFFGGVTLGIATGGHVENGLPFGLSLGAKLGVFSGISPGDDSPEADPAEGLATGLYGELRLPATDWLQVVASADGGFIVPTEGESRSPGGYLELGAGARFFMTEQPRIYVSTGLRGSGYTYDVARENRVDTLDGVTVRGDVGVGMAF